MFPLFTSTSHIKKPETRQMALRYGRSRECTRNLKFREKRAASEAFPDDDLSREQADGTANAAKHKSNGEATIPGRKSAAIGIPSLKRVVSEREKPGGQHITLLEQREAKIDDLREKLDQQEARFQYNLHDWQNKCELYSDVRMA